MIASIVSFILSGLFGIINFFLGLLPSFSLDLTGYVSGVSEYIGYLNWFFPVGTLITITEVWLVALVAYRAYLVFAGFFKMFLAAAE